MKNLTIQEYVLSALFVFIIGFTWSQESSKYSHNSLAEKIYLQLDNEIYTNNKTIWFKAVVANAVTHETDLSSGVLYVDLIDSEKNILDSKIIKLKDGIGNGHFDLDKSYIEGQYLIRAYTEWNKNFDSDFIFKKYIKVFEATKPDNEDLPIQNIRRVDTTLNTQQFKIDIYPELLDATHNKAITVIVKEDDKIDTLALNRNNEKKYVLDRAISKSTKYVQLKIKTDNNKTYTTSFSPNNNYIDLQFFPEGGDMVDGLSSKVGFKALGANGKGEFVEGVILNSNEEVITIFKSNELGMGHFVIDNVDGDEQYYAKLKSHTKKERIPLPKVLNQGTTLTVLKRGEMINVLVQSNHLNNTKVSLKTTCRGYEYYNSEATLVNRGFTYKFPIKELPEGVIAFTLLDENKTPIAERLYFNERRDSRLAIYTNSNNIEYTKREKVNVNIEVKDSENKLVRANASVLVINKDDYGSIQEGRDNIRSYFLLSSDIRGEIEKPGLYFKEDSELDIDDLLLTQGWRKYKYIDPIRRFNYKKEYGITVSGVVNLINSKTKKEKVELMLMTLGDNSAIYTEEVIASGNFTYNLNDLYHNEGLQDVIIQSVNIPEKEKKKYRIALKKKQELPIDYNYTNISIASDSITDKIVENYREQKQKEDQYYFSNTGVTELDEVLVKGYNLTPKRKEVMERFGEPDVVIEGKEIQAKEDKRYSNGIYSVLRDAFPDKITILRVRTGRSGFLLRARSTKGGRNHATLVVVDGIPVKGIDYGLIESISVDEVTSFEIIENAKNIKTLIAEAFNTVPPRGPITGSVIAVYTKLGKGLHGAINPKKSVNIKQIPVFSESKEYYTPKHDINNAAELLSPDLRSTIYWNPNIVFNAEEEKKDVSYYHSDNTGKFMIVIEAISEDGQIGYKTINYTVIDEYSEEN